MEIYLIKEKKINKYNIKIYGDYKTLKFDWDKFLKESFRNILEKNNGDSKKLILFLII